MKAYITIAIAALITNTAWGQFTTQNVSFTRNGVTNISGSIVVSSPILMKTTTASSSNSVKPVREFQFTSQATDKYATYTQAGYDSYSGTYYAYDVTEKVETGQKYNSNPHPVGLRNNRAAQFGCRMLNYKSDYAYGRIEGKSGEDSPLEKRRLRMAEHVGNPYR